MLLKGRCDLPPKWEVNAQKISLSAAANARPYVPSSREGHQRHLALPFTGRGFFTHLPMGNHARGLVQRSARRISPCADRPRRQSNFDRRSPVCAGCVAARMRNPARLAPSAPPKWEVRHSRNPGDAARSRRRGDRMRRRQLSCGSVRIDRLDPWLGPAGRGPVTVPTR